MANVVRDQNKYDQSKHSIWKFSGLHLSVLHNRLFDLARNRNRNTEIQNTRMFNLTFRMKTAMTIKLFDHNYPPMLLAFSNFRRHQDRLLTTCLQLFDVLDPYWIGFPDHPLISNLTRIIKQNIFLFPNSQQVTNHVCYKLPRIYEPHFKLCMIGWYVSCDYWWA